MRAKRDQRTRERIENPRKQHVQRSPLGPTHEKYHDTPNVRDGRTSRVHRGWPRVTRTESRDPTATQSPDRERSCRYQDQRTIRNYDFQLLENPEMPSERYRSRVRQTKHIRSMPYRQVPAMRDNAAAEIRKTLHAGVLEPATYEWASPIVLVPKKDGSLRFCVNYRRLNAKNVADAYPLPRIDDCRDSLGDAQIFMTLDCNAGYWQVPVAPEDRDAYSTTTGYWTPCVQNGTSLFAVHIYAIDASPTIGNSRDASEMMNRFGGVPVARITGVYGEPSPLHIVTGKGQTGWNPNSAYDDRTSQNGDLGNNSDGKDGHESGHSDHSHNSDGKDGHEPEHFHGVHSDNGGGKESNKPGHVHFESGHNDGRVVMSKSTVTEALGVKAAYRNH